MNDFMTIEKSGIKTEKSIENVKKEADFSLGCVPDRGVKIPERSVMETTKDRIRFEILKNENGFPEKHYFKDDYLIRMKEQLPGGGYGITHYDDNGLPYLREEATWDNGRPLFFKQMFKPDSLIVRGNYSVVTDSQGRPVLNEIKDVSIKDSSRESLTKVERTAEYRPTDEKGHIIADSLGGPADSKNVVAQDSVVNHSKFTRVENIVRDLKNKYPDSKIDYSVKSNYKGNDKRPSSFEPKITIDGKPYELDPDLKKIYNESEELSLLKKVTTTAHEGFEKSRNAGIELGIVSAGIELTVSSARNVSAFVAGEITGEEMAFNIAKDTATAGSTGFAIGFISKEASILLSSSSKDLIKMAGKENVVGGAIAFGIESYDTITNYAKGLVDLKEMSLELGENAVGVAGGIEGAKYGAGIGSAAGVPGGTFVGGIVGGMIGYTITTEAYETVTTRGAEGAKMLADKAQEFGVQTYENAKEVIPERAEGLRIAMNEYAEKAGLPFRI